MTFSTSIEPIISTAWAVSVTMTAEKPPATVKLMKTMAKATMQAHSG